MRTEILAVALALVACEPETVAPFPPERDASIPTRDSGPRIMHLDSGIDAGPPDAAADDGGGTGDGATGDGGGAPTIDGTIGAAEWADAVVSTADVPPVTPFAGDRLTRLLALRTPSRLYLAIEGTIEAGHAIVLYLDADFGGTSGVLLTSGNDLADPVGALDRALSAPLVSTLPELRPEYAWGTTSMPIALSGSGDTGGWREIASDPTNFATLATGNSTQCSASACETSVPLGVMGIEGAGSIAVFARAVNGSGQLSNQTLPLDSSGAPESITVVLLVP